MELKQVGASTYYIKNKTNIGIYKINNNEVYLIDTGNDKDAGKKILKILTENNLVVKGIINTHSHADHIGGNEYLQNQTHATIYASEIEESFINNPILEPTILYGASPIAALKNKFLLAKKSSCQLLKPLEGLEYLSLKGHSYNMIGLKTKDEIYFLGDALASEEVISKYSIFFLYDVAKYLETLETLKTLKGKLFILSHQDATSDIQALIMLNEQKIKEICANILKICQTPHTLETIIQKMFVIYHLTMSIEQHTLVGSTIKAYLKYLNENNKLTYLIKDNLLYWQISEV